MMRLFFGWLLGVERDGRPVVNDERGSHWGQWLYTEVTTSGGAIGDNCSTLR